MNEVSRDDALREASIPTLLMCVAQLSGDPRWLEPPCRPQRDVSIFADPTGGLPAQVQQAVRDAAARLLDELARGERTLPALPDVPTLDEAGVKGYEVNTWFGFVAPAGTPADVVARLNAEVYRAIALPAVREKLLAQGFDLSAPRTPAQFAKTVHDDLQQWVPLVRASGAKVD